MINKSLSAFGIPKMRRGDWDGFFGLFMDNLIQLMLIAVLCEYACGFPHEFIIGRILPGAALSILLGNLYYSWQAKKLAEKTGRSDVTALPFGINTVSLMAYIFLVMAPVFYDTGDWRLAWKIGLAACVLSGIIETAGAYVGDWLKRATPRAALLSALAGVALTFITLGFTFQVFASPMIAIVPMVLILIFYGAKVRLPFHFPGGMLAIIIGMGVAWTLKGLGYQSFLTPQDPIQLGFHPPIPVLGELFGVLFSPTTWGYISVIIPIGLFNVVSSIQNLESAEAAGDKFETKPSLLMNGFSTLLAGALGSPFPTTIYIGHPGWKTMGARVNYSMLNGIIISILCFMGAITAVLKIVPMEVALGVLIWIGIVMVAQPFQKTESKHAIAVVLGLIPALATWALNLIESCLRVVGTSLFDAYEYFGAEIYIDGILSLYQGFLLTGMILASIMAHVIDRNFLKASVWSAVAAILSAVGLIHAFELTPSGIQNHFGWFVEPRFFTVYAVIASILLIIHKSSSRRRPGSNLVQ
jgi:AGZA family xanthine/uracil permease-like MFS transporter